MIRGSSSLRKTDETTSSTDTISNMVPSRIKMLYSSLMVKMEQLCKYDAFYSPVNFLVRLSVSLESKKGRQMSGKESINISCTLHISLAFQILLRYQEIPLSFVIQSST